MLKHIDARIDAFARFIFCMATLGSATLPASASAQSNLSTQIVESRPPSIPRNISVACMRRTIIFEGQISTIEILVPPEKIEFTIINGFNQVPCISERLKYSEVHTAKMCENSNETSAVRRPIHKSPSTLNAMQICDGGMNEGK